MGTLKNLEFSRISLFFVFLSIFITLCKNLLQKISFLYGSISTVFTQLDYKRNLTGFIKRTEIVESPGLAYTALRFHQVLITHSSLYI